MKKLISICVAVLLVCAVSVVPVFAAASPTAPVYFEVIADVNNPAAGSAQAEPSEIKAGDIATLTVEVKPGFSFSGWNIEGDYTIVEGDLNSLTLVIKATSDIKAYANFSENPSSEEPTGTPSSSQPSSSQPSSSQPSSSGKPGPANSSSTSPKTGAPIFAGLALILLAGAGVAVVSKKRSLQK